MRRLPQALPKVMVFLIALSPLGYLVYQGFRNSLGPDPQLAVIHFTGLWAMYFLFITLCITPAYEWLNWRWGPKIRRMMGLYALFYAFLHIAAYTVFIAGLDLGLLIVETFKRPYIALGAIAFVTLCLLGATSTKGMMKRLGKRWKPLHRSVYWVTPLVVWHYYWSLKLNKMEVYPFIVLIICLLLLRNEVVQNYRKKIRQKSAQNIR